MLDSTSPLARLRLPVICSPMFLVSGPALVIAACKAGVVGTFPSLNQRTSEGLAACLSEIDTALVDDVNAAPYGVNLIAHESNPRLADDLELCIAHRVPLIITSLGVRPELVQRVQAYGGLVFHDVTTVRHARKAIEAKVDGLILVCAGAGGHSGTLSPFAFLPEVRALFAGPIVLGGAISSGAAIAAARVLGADLAYVGTRLIATQESMAVAGFKQMILDGTAADVVYTPAITGVSGNFLRASLRAVGLDPDNLPAPAARFKTRYRDAGSEEQGVKAWTHIWSAGQGIGTIDDVPAMAELVTRLEAEYRLAGGQKSHSKWQPEVATNSSSQ